MAAAVPYPAWLPLPLRDGYGFKPVTPLLTSRFQSGASLTRRRSTSTPTMVTLSWVLKDQSAALFEKWVQEDLVDGSAWFLCKLKTPLGVDYYRSRFTADFYNGPYLVDGNFWRFDATLEMFRRPLLADGSTAYPDAIFNSDIVDLAANREWPDA
ncbi:hypothetical protein NJG16_05560 [Stenotrophomonas maltophilia]|nr:hypothetical protein [Stenotrophomonas maltophilia]